MKYNFNQGMLLFATVLMIQEALADSNIPSYTSVDVTSNQRSSLRIIGGEDAREGMWPWMVYIGYTKYPEGPSCGGSLIHPYWVLTAAHCVDGFKEEFLSNCQARCIEQSNRDQTYCQTYCNNKSCVKGTIPPLTGDDMFVVAGLHKRKDAQQPEKRLAIAQVIQHPQWNFCNHSWHFDIALVQLEEPIMQPLITLPLKDNGEIKPDTLATALGWGLIELKEGGISPDVLQKVELPIVSNETCQASYEGEFKIIDSMICAGFKEGKKDTCSNDSGGPLVVFKEDEWQQVGLVSFGGHNNTEGAPICAGPDAYGVYTRVSAFINFIAQYVPLSITGAYDGVWTSPALPDTFVVLRNTTETLALAFLSQNGQNWQALLGPLSYPTITMKKFIGPTNIILELEPTLVVSPPIREISMTTVMCRPTSGNCLLPQGNTIKLNKIF